jgi:hypothetical protein
MILWKLKRKKHRDKQTVGTMDVYEDEVFLFSLATLEQEWNDNAIGNSCIPKGGYTVKDWDSKKHPISFIVEGTEPRTFILFHVGNYNYHSQGCILPGMYHEDINKDGYIDVAQSGNAMGRLNTYCRGKTMLLEIS